MIRIGELDPRIVSLDDPVHQAIAESEYIDTFELEVHVDAINKFIRNSSDDQWHKEVLEEMLARTAPGGHFAYSHIFIAAFEDRRRQDSKAELVLNGPARNLRPKIKSVLTQNGVTVSVADASPIKSTRSRKAKCNKTFGRPPRRTYCGKEASFLKTTGKTSRQYRCKDCFPDNNTGYRSLKVGLSVPPSKTLLI